MKGSSALGIWLGRLLFGSDHRMRARSAQTLVAFVLYLAFAALHQAAARMGMLDARTADWLNVFNLTGALVFYVAVRTGWYRRWFTDAVLTMVQMSFAMVCISLGYANTGFARAVPLVLMPLILPFGAVVLSPRQLSSVAVAGLAMLFSAMAWRAHGMPLVYEPRVEVLHAAAAAAVVAGASAVAISLGRLRRVMLRHRGELEQALERIQALATHDDLTGLLNRRAVLERLQLELRERHLAPRLCVALIDLDHFKRVNDRFGHAAGDQVLRRFSTLARDELRGGDIIARWGGEEFLVMMPGADTEQGLRGLDRIRQRLRLAPMDDIEPGLIVSFSAGVAQCHGESDLDEAIERADTAMYLAKQSGRDRALAAA